MKNIILQLLMSFYAITSFAVKDSSMVIPMISGSVAFQLPSGGIAERFGHNYSVGSDFTLKTRSNFLIGVDFEFITGNKLKNTGIFENIQTSNGYLLNKEGEYAYVVLSERGFYIGAKIGKQFPVFAPNPNSGIFITIGSGLLQYKTRIENEGNNVPAIIDDYAKGYDKLTNGLALKEFIAYRYLSNKQTINFYFGFEFYQAWTQNRRDIDFVTMQKDNTLYNDFLSSFRFGWIIPIYKRMPREFYYD